MSSNESIASRRFLGLVWVGTASLLGGQIAVAQTCSATSEIRVGPLDGESLDQLGTSVALSGSTAFLGTPGRVNPDPSLPAFTTTGTVYVARRNGSTWNITQQMFPPDGANLDKFGKAVALDGAWGVVGAPGDDTFAGSAYVYQSNADGSVWSYRQKLLSPTRMSYEYFGQSVAISGSTIVIGAFGNGTYKGRAYVYHWNGSTWTWVQTLTASDAPMVVAAAYDFFAYPVATSGNVILVGIYGDDIIGTNSGTVYVYRSADSGVTWAYSQTFAPADSASGDSFGWSVALDGATAVIGAPADDSTTGSAYVFRDNGSSFQQEAKLVASDRKALDRFGESVAISGSAILVGVQYWTNNARGIGQQGKAYYFACDGTAWREKLSLLQTSPPLNEDHFGSAVALDGGSAVVGTPGEDYPAPTDAGKAYFFDITCAGCLTNADCADDGNPCTSEVCSSGTCTHPLKAAGAACPDDGNACTTDTCDSTGVCQHPSVPAGTFCTDDGNPCTNDLCSTGVCTHPNKPSGTSCSDSNLCNGTETCQSGACMPGTPLVCTADQCHNPGTCNTSTGVCSAPTLKANGTTCNDGNACTQTDTCQSGVCAGSNPVVCSADQCHNPGICNTSTGVCSVPTVKPNGTACGSTASTDCDNPDTCSNGTCVPNYDPSGTLCTDDGNACTSDTCSGAGSCTHPIKANGTACGSPATTDCDNPDTCGNGTCVPNYDPSGTLCTDDGNACTNDTCNGAGGCTHPNKTNGTACGSPANTDCDNPDTCSSGTCVPNYDPSGTLCTNDGNACTNDTCDGTGSCMHPNKTNGTSCSDGDVCNGAETCQNGACAPGTALNCNDSNACTTDTCVPATGCTHSNAVNGTACGSQITTDCDYPDTCNNGTCVSNYASNGTLCTDDGNACTTDSCSAGVCQHLNNTNMCNDGNACTTDSCVPATGCLFTWPTCGLADGCCGPTCTRSNDPDCSGLLLAGASCTSNSECYSASCRGPRGRRTCK